MRKKLILLLIAAIAVISSAEAQSVPKFNCGPYGALVTIVPTEGTPPFEMSVNGVNQDNLSFFALYGDEYQITLRDQNGILDEIQVHLLAQYFRVCFNPANIEVGEQTINISDCEFFVLEGQVVPLTGDTVIARPTSGQLRVVQDPLSMIDTLLVFDTIVIIDTITVVEIDPVGTNANVSLYPNPTVGQLNIECPSVIREVAIFNTLGQQVVTSYNLGNKGSMDLTTLPKGTYTMRITLNDGRDSVYKLVRN